MNTTRALLAAVKARHQLTSDYQLAKFLGVSKQRISANQLGAVMTDEAAILVADALGLDHAHVMALVAAERAKSEKAKKAWQRAAAATAALALVAVHFALTGTDGGALNLLAYAAALPLNSSIHYALILSILAAAWCCRTNVRRRLALVAILVPILAGCATPRDAWDRTDTALGGAALAATIIDWGQTRTVAKHPELYQETNPILGQHPSLRTVNTYFATAIVGSAVIAHALPGEWRKGFLGGITVWEIHITNQNKKFGVGVTF